MATALLGSGFLAGCTDTGTARLTVRNSCLAPVFVTWAQRERTGLQRHRIAPRAEGRLSGDPSWLTLDSVLLVSASSKAPPEVVPVPPMPETKNPTIELPAASCPVG